MKLRQKIFVLEGVNVDFNLKSEEGDLILVVNGYTTTIKFEDLFVGNTKRLKNSIKGHSILQGHDLVDGFLIDGDDNKYSLYFNEKNILFKKVNEPIIQALDIDLSDTDHDKYLDVLIDGIKQCREQENKDSSDSPEEEVKSEEENIESAKVDTKVVPPTPDNPADEIQLEEIISELEESGYDHFGKDQYNVFLQHNMIPVLYIGKEKAEYIETVYDEKDKASLTFMLRENTVIIGLEKDAIIFPASSTDLSTEDLSKVEALGEGVSHDTIELESGEVIEKTK